MGLALGIGLAGCGGTPPFGGDAVDEGGADGASGSVYLDEQGQFLTLNNIAYDAATDTLTLNNIPFDDPQNAYQRIPTEQFSNGFDAYQSAPAPGSNEVQYFAVFRRSDSGASQVAAVGTPAYIQFGYGGAGAQRLGGAPNLPATGIYSYSGEYAGVRTNLNAGPSGENVITYVTGEVELAVDFDDFDDTGTVGGFVTNRALYNDAGQPIGALDGFISLQDSTIDFTNATIGTGDASEVVGGQVIRSGNWEGVLAGPNGSEIAGILFVEGSPGNNNNGIRETGGFIAEQ
ncbi:hypothetical protein BOO69_05375 [Sulfitobacter alexandrii]|uniref:Transferrin-binding protein B C-lobe/N-lobe beta barrel domain-containing protein n=2 Tax=Sulfitobacter alexandrii TaxID=1917485 RepID=A0A1J0WF27_9RHOB|nr:hypothetical protein BOO69_05375 [Sulfitobacter alexandrii]